MAKKDKKKKVEEADATPAEAPPAKKRKLSDASAGQAEESYAVPDSKKIWIGGVNKTLDESAVKKHFAKCGDIEAVAVPKNKRGQAMGIAFITFKKTASATNAVKLNSTQFEGKEIAVKLQDDRGQVKTKTPPTEGGLTKSQLRKKRKKAKLADKKTLIGKKESTPKTDKPKERPKTLLKLDGAAGERMKQKNNTRRTDDKFNAKLAASEAGEGKPKKTKKKVADDEE